MSGGWRYLSSATIVVALVAAGLAGLKARHRSQGWSGQPAAVPEAADGIRRGDDRWLRLRDPATGEIPIHSATRSLAHVKAMATATAGSHRPLVRSWARRGPANIGGRTKALAIDVRNESVLLAGGVSGGMWKSVDGGASWTKTTAVDALHSVSCIAQNTAPGREATWYYGTGEWSPYGNGGSAGTLSGTNVAYRGDGIFKSTDGGESWTLLPSTTSGTPLATDSFDFVWSLATFGSDGVYAATSAGLYRSTDGGAGWAHVLDHGSAYTNTEVAIAPNGTVYATVGGSGPATGIYRSADGLAWERFSPPDFPAATLRTLIAFVPSNPSVLYFFTCVDNLETHLYRWEPGVGWSDLRANLPWGGDMVTYGGNMLLFKVKPDDENVLFLGSTGFFRSLDRGASFQLVGDGRDFFVDQHSLVFYPSDARRMIVGNDGGLFRTADNTASVGSYPITWESLNRGYLTSQFYTVALDHGTPGSPMVGGGMQDNGCAIVRSGKDAAPWETIMGGDGGFVAIADGGDTVYTNVGATLFVARHTWDGAYHELTEVTPSAALMGLWLAPFTLDPHDQRIMYLPCRRELWRNSDLTAIPYVFPATKTNVNWERLENVDATISALGMSEGLPRRLYYGTNVGQLGRIDNPQVGQPVPTVLPLDSLPTKNRSAYVGAIAVDPLDTDRLLVSYPNFGVVSIFSSEDGGLTWTPVAGNLEEQPDGSGAGPSVRWVAMYRSPESVAYFAATDSGLFSASRLEGNATVWVQEGAGSIGTIVVDMVDVRQSDGTIAVGTHGNGVYTGTLIAPPRRRASGR